MKYERYKRGQLVLADFSPQVGSETQGKHLAIVLTKNDSPNNGVLTVVPLSSKQKSYYLNLGSFLISSVKPYLDETMRSFKEDIEALDANLIPSKANENMQELIDKTSYNMDEFLKIINIYTKMNKPSYAMVQNITTISKQRVLKPYNRYDPIKKAKVSNEILDKIEAEIKKLFFK